MVGTERVEWLFLAQYFELPRENYSYFVDACDIRSTEAMVGNTLEFVVAHFLIWSYGESELDCCAYK